MRSVERIASLRIVIEAPTCPTVRIVAKRTIAREAALVIPVLVTTRTGAGRVLERGRAMAFLARQNGMTPDQRESGEVVIEGHFLTPARFPVALLAAAAELSFVGIVLLVTGHAARRQLVAIEIAGVTGIAFDLGVLTSQWKLGLFVVVETHRLPLGRGVAGLALGAVAAGVRVLQPMTGSTGRRQVLVALAGMTGGASDILVSAVERESGLAVIERLDATPAVLAVATIAFLPKSSLVRIL